VSRRQEEKSRKGVPPAKGCILPGTKQDPKNPDYVGNDSYHEAFDRIMKIVTDTQKLDKWKGDTTTLTVTQF
jgi:hypothetical protein